MKKILYIILVFLSAGPLLSCKDFLDVDYFAKEQQSIDKVFQSRDYTYQWLAGLYSKLSGVNADVASKKTMPFNFMSDDMFYGDNWGGMRYETLKNGKYTEEDFQASWGQCYEGIRDASIFLANIEKNDKMREGEMVDTRGQARFVRAYLYWELLRKYGPIPIMPDGGIDYTLEYSKLTLPRSSYDECADYIANEMAKAALDLPPRSKRTINNIAMATRGAALATRAKVLLFAASPLFNGGKQGVGNAEMASLVDNKGRKLISQTYDESKWARAAAAARDVIELGDYKLFTAPFRATSIVPYMKPTIVPPYHAVHSDANFPDGWKNIDPFESYRQLFNGEQQAFGNEELIFSRVTEQGGESVMEMVKHQVPTSMSGINTHGVTQKQCDAYQMKDGTPFDKDNRSTAFTTNDTDYKPLAANVSLQYADREPRFYASIAYNGSIWEAFSDMYSANRDKQIFYYRGSLDGFNPSTPQRSIRSGIGIKKYYNPLDAWQTTTAGDVTTDNGYRVFKPEPAIRYAEVLLIYGEALNELTGTYQIANYRGDAVYTVERDVVQMSSALGPVRVRAGVPDFDAATYADHAALRQAIKHERQVELFAENHRYYDLRRWMDAKQEETEAIQGCNMTMGSSAAERVEFHKPILLPALPSVFLDKTYLWPMSHGVLRRSRALTQNPGWTYFD